MSSIFMSCICYVFWCIYLMYAVSWLDMKTQSTSCMHMRIWPVTELLHGNSITALLHQGHQCAPWYCVSNVHPLDGHATSWGTCHACDHTYVHQSQPVRARGIRSKAILAVLLEGKKQLVLSVMLAPVGYMCDERSRCLCCCADADVPE